MKLVSRVFSTFQVGLDQSIEGFAGPLELRMEAGDEIYLNNGTYNNLRVTAGPGIPVLGGCGGSCGRGGSACSFEHRRDEGKGKTDDIGIVAGDSRNPSSCAPLNRIGPGLVHGLAGGDVGSNFFFGQGEEADAGDFCSDLGPLRGDNGDAGDGAVSAAGEQPNHACGVGGIRRFSQDLIVEGDGGVGAHHLRWGGRSRVARTCICYFREDCFGLLTRKADDVSDGVLVGEWVLRNVRRVDSESVSSLGEQFAAAWGS